MVRLSVKIHRRGTNNAAPNMQPRYHSLSASQRRKVISAAEEEEEEV